MDNQEMLSDTEIETILEESMPSNRWIPKISDYRALLKAQIAHLAPIRAQEIREAVALMRSSITDQYEKKLTNYISKRDSETEIQAAMSLLEDTAKWLCHRDGDYSWDSIKKDAGAGVHPSVDIYASYIRNAESLFRFLSERGVVVKDENQEMPNTPQNIVFYGGGYGYSLAQVNMKDAGFVKTLPLPVGEK